MSEQPDETRSESRRDFLRGAGMAAGGFALIGAESNAAAQAPNAEQAPAAGQQKTIRASAAEKHLKHLGPLHNLGGTWVGGGFNLISLPDFADNKPFRVKLNTTQEILEFSQIGGPVPNRGSTARRTSTSSA